MTSSAPQMRVFARAHLDCIVADGGCKRTEDPVSDPFSLAEASLDNTSGVADIVAAPIRKMFLLHASPRGALTWRSYGTELKARANCAAAPSVRREASSKIAFQKIEGESR